MKTLMTLVALMLSSFSLQADERLDAALSDFASRDYSGARAKLEAISPAPASANYLFHLAASQQRTGDAERARDTLDALFAVAPDHEEGLYLQGINNMSRLNSVGLFKKIGVAKSALASWQRVIDVNPQSVAGHYAVFSYYLNAPGMAGGDKKKAKQMLPTIRTLSPAYGEVAAGLLASKEKDPAAEAHFLRGAELGGDLAAPYFSLGQYYFEQEEFASALKAIDAFEARQQRWFDPDRSMTLFYRGTLYAGMGKPDEARRYLELAIDSASSDRIRELASDALDEL